MAKVKKILVVMNHLKVNPTLLKEMRDFWDDKGLEYVEYHVGENSDYMGSAELEGVGLAVSLGGDGTLLHCAKIVAGKKIPILAVNLGNLGFITEIPKEEWQDAFIKFENDELPISKRMMLKVCVFRDGNPAGCYWGLNDGVIGTSGISKIIRLKVYISETYIGRYRADGVIVATPTGSTAYSMAAGGPILHPEMDALILSPICPFTLSNRPLVIPSKEKLEILIEREQRTNIVLTVDGKDAFKLQPDDRVVFERSQEKTLIIQSDKRNFYEVLRAKLNWAGEPNA